ncbi:MAG: hypothetical protein SGBAC_000731 [Bacillariaceae sp.]
MPTRQASPLPLSRRNSQSIPPRKKSDYARVPSSPQTYLSSSTPRSGSPSTASEKEHRLKTSSPKGVPTATRGRLANMALEKGLSSRNARSRSPFIEKRMRSFSRDREQSNAKPSEEQRPQQANQSQHVMEAGKAAPDRTQPRQTYGTSSSLQATETTKLKAVSVRGERSNVAAFWNGKKNQITPSPKASIESPKQRLKKQEEEKETEKETNSTESKQSNSDLMAKLNAVDRANPAQALAQIDFILREEGRVSSFEPILVNPNVGNDDDSAGTTISSLTNPDYRDWQHHQQLRANQHVPNQIASTAVSSFRRPRPSHLQNYSTNSFVKEKSSLPNHEKQSQPIPTTALDKIKARQMTKLASSSKQASPNSYSSAINQEKASPLPRPSALPTQRSHPWDGDAPDTASIPVSIPPKEETIDANTHHEQSTRSRNTVPVQIPAMKETNSGSSGLSDEEFNINGKKSNFTAYQSTKKVSTPRITPRQYENAKKISDSFDATWALMPESGFAPAANSKRGKQGGGSQSSRSSRTSDLNTTFDTPTNASRSYHSRSASIPEDGDSEGINGEKFSIEVSLYNPDSNTPNKVGSKPKSRAKAQTSPAAPIQTAQSESIDMFRTASMAQKYNRVMRLYDDE